MLRAAFLSANQILLSGSLPNRPSDAYHSCYVLSGLSSAQYQWTLVTEKQEGLYSGEGHAIPIATATATSSFEGGAPTGWVVDPYLGGEQIFDEVDRVCQTHPVYAIPPQKVADIMAYFATKAGF